MPDIFPVANTSCVPQFCYQLVYCCLIRYFLFRIDNAKCFMNRSKRFWCKVHFWEWTHVLLVKTKCSHLHSFGATGVSSLETRMTLTQLSRGRMGELITQGWICLWFHDCTVVIVVGLCFKWYTLHNQMLFWMMQHFHCTWLETLYVTY
jgi:hypothetical protein